MFEQVYRHVLCGVTASLLLIASNLASGQVFRLGEMTKTQYQELDRDRTAILMPIGVIEEHGPYLPLLTDSYISEWLITRVANAIVSRDGWTAIVMPSLPVGVGAPEDFGPRARDYGSLPLRPTTKRAILMDLVTGLGDADFRWIFAVDIHGPFVNKRMTDEASEYFEDTYGGTMLNLAGVEHPNPPVAAEPLSEEERQEDGLAVHAGINETSWLMYVRPDLYDQRLVNASPVTAHRWEDYQSLPNKDDWPGYFGSPRLARAAIGADQMEAWAHNLADLAIRIIEGMDHRSLVRLADGDNPAINRLDGLIEKQAKRVAKQQEKWMQEKGVK